jgi:hypothetical protein
MSVTGRTSLVGPGHSGRGRKLLVQHWHGDRPASVFPNRRVRPVADQAVAVVVVDVFCSFFLGAHMTKAVCQTSCTGAEQIWSSSFFDGSDAWQRKPNITISDCSQASGDMTERIPKNSLCVRVLRVNDKSVSSPAGACTVTRIDSYQSTMIFALHSGNCVRKKSSIV